MASSRLVYGIDLGTTYSCIAQIDKFDVPIVLRNFEGDVTTPSVVYINENMVVVGKEAKHRLTDEPENTVALIKRSMGIDADFKKPTKFPNGLDPSEISALILKKLVQDANAASDNSEAIKDVVITCPAYFGTKERLQTKQAGEIAGLNVLDIINEPVAAAISYGIRLDARKTILVYDLGGGTFDVTIIRVDGGTIKVIATGGDARLGGVDWDIIMSEYMLDTYNEEHGTDYAFDTIEPGLRNTLLLEAEQKKKTLTAIPKVVATVAYDGKSTRVEITRQKFDELTKHMLDETMDTTMELVAIAKTKGVKKIDEVLLVGGSSRMPQIKARIDSELGVNALLNDPDECVAKGAAIFAMNEAYGRAVEAYEGDSTGTVKKPELLGRNTRTRVVNVTSKTYGMGCRFEGEDNMVANLIFANTSLPTKATESFYTIVDNQSGISIRIFESDVTDAENDRGIPESAASLLKDGGDGVRILNFSRNDYPQGTEVVVSFEIDEAGILSVHAELKSYPADKINFTLKLDGVKTPEELAKSSRKIGQYYDTSSEDNW